MRHPKKVIPKHCFVAKIFQLLPTSGCEEQVTLSCESPLRKLIDSPLHLVLPLSTVCTAAFHIFSNSVLTFENFTHQMVCTSAT